MVMKTGGNNSEQNANTSQLYRNNGRTTINNESTQTSPATFGKLFILQLLSPVIIVAYRVHHYNALEILLYYV